MAEEHLYGTIRSVVYQNPENGYAVLKLETHEEEMVTAVGTIPMPAPGEVLSLAGEWTTHAAYGKQFKGEIQERLLPTSLEGITQYLSGGAVPGIGKKTAEKLVNLFGSETLAVLERHPERLQTEAGMSLKRSREITNSFRSQICARQLVEFLGANDIAAAIALRAYQIYGDEALELIQQNPYLLTDERIGAGFTQADRLAIAIQIPADDPRRVEAGLSYELEYNLSSGHVFLPEKKLVPVTAQMLELDTPVAAQALKRLEETGAVIADTVNGGRVCYLARMYEAETYTAQRLCQLAKGRPQSPPELQSVLSSLADSTGIRFTPEQTQAIRMGVEGQLLVLTGGPGTGKTTTVRGLLAAYDALGFKTLMAAPTGRAAKRIEELCGRDASTIHRMLEVQFDEATGQLIFFHDEDCPLKADAIIVDEVSMLDIALMAALLKAVPAQCRLVLVGDRDQLPSVGPGRVLSGILRSGIAPTVRLGVIFRQAEQSLIVTNAHAVNRGELPILNATDRDFFFLKRKTAEDVVTTVCDLCKRRLPENMGIPADQIQVLSPTRLYGAGTVNLNRRLQEALNPAAPGKQEVTFGDYLFRTGDRVMQVRNNYDIIWIREDGEQGCGVFNGDVGCIESLQAADKLLCVRYDDRVVEYSFDMLTDLEPAYAMTVHKSQGSEYRAVVLALFQGPQQLLSRSVLYTAITRARDLLILVGDEAVVERMTHNAAQSRRFSALRYRLTKESGDES